MSGFLRTGLRRGGTIAVTVLPLGRTVELASGKRLLDALLLASGVTETEDCGGPARCRICHVLVIRGARGLSKVSKGERDWLDQIAGAEPESRLSCKAVLGNHEVTIQLINH